MCTVLYCTVLCCGLLTSSIGTIMAVVAALLNHMDMAAVSSMKQSMMAGGEVPDTCR